MVPIDDILALVFGMLFTMRKLEVMRREPEHHPAVRQVDFEAWKAKALTAYRLGANACFLKVIIGLGMYLLLLDPDLGTIQAVIVTARVVVVAWLVALVTAGVLAHRAGKMRDELGIGLGAPPPAG